jgi:hypothetical protein
LSPNALGYRVATLDNVKSLKFSWAELEGLIACQTISGRRLYHGEGRRPNTMTIFITLNGASLSKDLAQRCVIVKLKRPKRNPLWREEMPKFIADNRWAIIGDLIAKLKAPAAPLGRHSRWGAWEDAVLARLPKPDDVQKVIEERQRQVDDDASEVEIVREAFELELIRRGHKPLSQTIRIPSYVAALIVNRATLENRNTGKATTHLTTAVSAP